MTNLYASKPKGNKPGRFTNGTKPDPQLEAAAMVADAIRAAFVAESDENPPALAALAVSIAGPDLEFPVGKQLARIADGIESLAVSVEYLAENLFEEEEPSKSRSKR